MFFFLCYCYMDIFLCILDSFKEPKIFLYCYKYGLTLLTEVSEMITDQILYLSSFSFFSSWMYLSSSSSMYLLFLTSHFFFSFPLSSFFSLARTSTHGQLPNSDIGSTMLPRRSSPMANFSPLLREMPKHKAPRSSFTGKQHLPVSFARNTNGFLWGNLEVCCGKTLPREIL